MLRAAVGMFKGRVRMFHAQAWDAVLVCGVTERRVPLPDALLFHLLSAQRCYTLGSAKCNRTIGEQGY